MTFGSMRAARPRHSSPMATGQLDRSTIILHIIICSKQSAALKVIPLGALFLTIHEGFRDLAKSLSYTTPLGHQREDDDSVQLLPKERIQSDRRFSRKVMEEWLRSAPSLHKRSRSPPTNLPDFPLTRDTERARFSKHRRYRRRLEV